MKKKLLIFILLIITLSGCSSQNSLTEENIRPSVGTSEYANYKLNKAYISISNPGATSQATEASATYLKLILEEEKKQTDLLQKIYDIQ